MTPQDTLIQKQLKGALTVSEQQAFDRLMKEDSAFAKAYKEHTNLHHAIAQEERHSLKAQLQALEKQTETIKTPKGNLWLKMAAVAVIALLSGVLLFNNTQTNKTGAQLYASYYEAYPNVLQPVTRSTDEVDAKMATFMAYENNDWKTAIEGFQDLLNERDEANLRFYYAMSLLNAGKSDQAYTQLKRTSKESSRFKAQSLWYKALIELQEEDKTTALQSLKALKALNSGFKDQNVEDLIDTLD